MSELLGIDRHNYANPKCPECNSVSVKNGRIQRKHGLIQRYRCFNCGKTFQTILRRSK